MRWTLFIPLALAGCSSGPTDPVRITAFEWRQDIKRSIVASGAMEEHLATCPAKTMPVSGGFSIVGGAESFVATASRPDGNKWRARIRNASPTSQPVELVVYVACVAA